PSIFELVRTPPSLAVFPYTTLFRSGGDAQSDARQRQPGVGAQAPVEPGAAVIPDQDAAYKVETEVEGGAHPSEAAALVVPGLLQDRKGTRLNSSHVKTSYAVFCLKK